MTVLITGATGYVGSRLAAELVRNGEKVKALVRGSSNVQDLQSLGVELVVGDLLDYASLVRPMKGCDTVYHVGSLYQRWIPDNKAFFLVNVTGAKNLFRAALNEGVRRVVYTSTCLTLGARRGELVSEETVHRGGFLSEYERSKYLAEREALDLVPRGLPLVCVNPGGIYGPGEFKTLGRLIQLLCSGKPLFFLDCKVSLAYINDVIKGHILAAEKGRVGERYLLVGDNSTLAEVLSVAARAAGVPYRPRPLPYWFAYVAASLLEVAFALRSAPPPLVRSAVKTSLHSGHFDSAKARLELGLAFTSLEEGLAETVRWHRGNELSAGLH